MNKIAQLSLISAILLSPTLALANHSESCPSVAQIKSGDLGGWRLYRHGSESPANPQEIATFKQTVKSFKVALWQDKPLPARCGYNLDTNLKVFLAKKAAKPENNQVWTWELPGQSAYCKSNLETCLFGEDH